MKLLVVLLLCCLLLVTCALVMSDDIVDHSSEVPNKGSKYGQEEKYDHKNDEKQEKHEKHEKHGKYKKEKHGKYKKEKHGKYKKQEKHGKYKKHGKGKYSKKYYYKVQNYVGSKIILSKHLSKTQHWYVGYKGNNKHTIQATHGRYKGYYLSVHDLAPIMIKGELKYTCGLILSKRKLFTSFWKFKLYKHKLHYIQLADDSKFTNWYLDYKRKGPKKYKYKYKYKQNPKPKPKPEHEPEHEHEHEPKPRDDETEYPHSSNRSREHQPPKKPGKGHKEPEKEYKKPEKEHKKPEKEHKKPEKEHKKPEKGHKKPKQMYKYLKKVILSKNRKTLWNMDEVHSGQKIYTLRPERGLLDYWYLDYKKGRKGRYY